MANTDDWLYNDDLDVGLLEVSESAFLSVARGKKEYFSATRCVTGSNKIFASPPPSFPKISPHFYTSSTSEIG